jgi:hypothetical protein
MQYFSSCTCFVLLSVMSSSSIHFHANNRVSLFFMVEYYFAVYLYCIFFIHPSTDWHLG